MAANVDIIIRAQNQASGVISQVQRDLSGLDRAAATAERGLSGLQKTVGVGMAAATGLAVAGVGALAVGLSKSVTVAADFESQMNVLGVAARSSGTAISALSDAALRVGSDTDLVGVSASEAADAMTNFYKAGLSTNEIFSDLQGYLAGTTDLSGALRSAVDLAAASELDLATASDVVAVSMATFGLQAADASRIADVLVQAADSSLASVGGLSEGLVNVGPVAASMGMSLEEVSTALAILSTRGIQGSEAGTAMRSMLLNLQRPTKAVQTALDELGVSLFDADGTMRDLPAIIGSLESAMAGLTEEQRNQYATTLAGTYGLAAFQTLVGEGAAGWASMTDAIGKAASAQQIAMARTKGFNAAMEQLWGSVESFMISVGTPLLQVFLTPLIQMLTEVVGKLTEFAPSVQDVETVLAQMLATGQQVVATITAFVTPVTDAIGAFVSWKDVLIVLAGVAASIVIPALIGIVTAAAPVIAVFAALVAGVALMRIAWENNWGGIQEIVGTVVGALGSAFETLSGYFGAIVEDGDYLNDWLTHFPEWMQPAVEWIGKLTAAVAALAQGGSFADFLAAADELTGLDISGWVAGFTAAWENVQTAVGDAVAFVSERWTALQDAFAAGDTSWSEMFGEISAQMRGVGTAADGAMPAVASFVEALTGSEEAAATVVGALGSIGAAVSPVVTALTDAQAAVDTFTASGAWATASSEIGTALGNIGTQISGAMSGDIDFGTLQATITTQLSDIGTAISALFQSEAFTRLSGELSAALGLDAAAAAIAPQVEAIKAAIQPLIDFLAPAFERLNTTVSGLGGYFANIGTQIEPVKTALGELVAAFEPVATAISGLFSGGDSGSSPSAAASVLAGALALVLNVVNGLAAAIEPLVSGVLAELATVLSGLATIVGGLTTAIGGMISGDTAAVWAGLGTAAQGVADILTGTLQNALGVISGLLTALGTTITGTLSDWGFDAAAASVQGVIDNVTALIDWLGQLAGGEVSIGAVMPEWIANLLAWRWPGFPSAPSWVTSLMAWIWPTLESVQWVLDLLAWAWPGLPGADWIGTLLTWNWPTIPGAGWIEDLLNWDWPGLPSLPSWLGGGNDTTAETTGNNASGTPFWRGGLTWVGESGRELVQLPRGSAIYSNRESERMAASGAQVTVYATVQSDIDMETLAWRVVDLIGARA